MRFLKPRPKPRLSHTATLVKLAIQIAYRYKRDRSYKPTLADLQQFTSFKTYAWEYYCTIQYLERCMHQRYLGQPEQAAKFSHKEAFDYHYPP